MESRNLEIIPGVGKAMAADLRQLDVNCVEDLTGQNPQELYDRLCILQGSKLDRCVLYVFRCAVYYAENETHDAELLKWWNWKERIHPNEKKEDNQ
uniref:Pathogenicity locus n=1 Tax=uncultured Bacillota bacterium TaxID=344338 RepID=A0A650EPY8_9FIRM|nr:hypothetical protein Firmicute1046_0700 [uncultured Firmicutes bacterium]